MLTKAGGVLEKFEVGTAKVKGFAGVGGSLGWKDCTNAATGSIPWSAGGSGEIVLVKVMVPILNNNKEAEGYIEVNGLGGFTVAYSGTLAAISSRQLKDTAGWQVALYAKVEAKFDNMKLVLVNASWPLVGSTMDTVDFQ